MLRVLQSSAIKRANCHNTSTKAMCSYMISGAAIYSCGPEGFAMQEGDTLSFDAKFPHGFKEIKSDTIEFITVSMKPE